MAALYSQIACQPSSFDNRPSCTMRMNQPIAAEAPSKRDQSSWLPSRTGVTSTSAMAGLSPAEKSGRSDTPGAGGMSVTASMRSSSSNSRLAFSSTICTRVLRLFL